MLIYDIQMLRISSYERVEYSVLYIVSGARYNPIAAWNKVKSQNSRLFNVKQRAVSINRGDISSLGRLPNFPLQDHGLLSSLLWDYSIHTTSSYIISIKKTWSARVIDHHCHSIVKLRMPSIIVLLWTKARFCSFTTPTTFNKNQHSRA